MRSNRDAAWFSIDAKWVLTDPDVKLLSASDRGGLLSLMAAAWLDPECSIPADDERLAALAGMGEGDWLGGKIRKHLGRFFRPTAGGRLRCVRLTEARAREEEIRGKRRRAGRASAVARLLKTVAVTTPPAAASTGIQLPPDEQPSNTRATHDEHRHDASTRDERVCNMCCACVDVEAGGGIGYVYNVMPETQLRHDARTPVASDPAAVPPAPGKLYCSENAATRSTAVTCDPEAQPEPRPTPRCAPKREVASPPPTPPLERGSSSDSYLNEESEKRSSISGGCAKEGRTSPQVATEQLDLFGPPQAKPRRPRAARVTGAIQEAACRVVDAYQLSVGPSHRRTPQADRNVAWWIVDGHSEADLTRAARNYAAFCDRAERDPDFRKSAVNFFGRKDPVFRSFLKETQDDTQRPGTQQQRYVDELERGLAEAFARVGAGSL